MNKLSKRPAILRDFEAAMPYFEADYAESVSTRLPRNPASVLINLKANDHDDVSLKPLEGKLGWLACSKSFTNSTDFLIIVGTVDGGEQLDIYQRMAILHRIDASGDPVALPTDVQAILLDATKKRQTELSEMLSGEFCDCEMDKLERCSDDQRSALNAQLDELDMEIRDLTKSARLAPSPSERLELQRTKEKLETKRTEAWRAYDAATRDIDHQKDSLLDAISQKLVQVAECERLFTVRWRIA